MKKLLLTTILTSSLLLTACQADTIKSASANANLESKGYEVEVYNQEETKLHIQNLYYDNFTFTDALYATKGQDDDADFLIAIFFKNVDDASTFLKADNNGNLAKMNNYSDTHLGKNLTKRLGTYNNVAYFGSETSFAVAFPDVL